MKESIVDIEALVVVFKIIMVSDGQVSDIEKKKFFSFFKQHYTLSSDEMEALFEQVNVDNFKFYVEKVKKNFEKNSMKKIEFMQILNQLIISDGINDKEYEAFNKIKRELI